MTNKYEVIFLQQAKDFLDDLDEKKELIKNLHSR